MFDVGFSEMIVIGVVALVVLGPERLPKVARTLGVLFGRMQRYVAQVKSDISREMEAAELGKVKTEFENAARSFQSDIESQAAETERELRNASLEIERSVSARQEEPAASAPEAPAPSPQLELGIEEPAAPRRDAPAP
jgi:sec-independent protein translocase protein TatB